MIVEFFGTQSVKQIERGEWPAALEVGDFVELSDGRNWQIMKRLWRKDTFGRAYMLCMVQPAPSMERAVAAEQGELAL